MLCDAFAGELIDTQWDVNATYNLSKSLVYAELIDTQWDVNYIHLKCSEQKVTELIDTQWDVNYFNTTATYNEAGN